MNHYENSTGRFYQDSGYGGQLPVRIGSFDERSPSPYQQRPPLEVEGQRRTGMTPQKRTPSPGQSEEKKWKGLAAAGITAVLVIGGTIFSKEQGWVLTKIHPDKRGVISGLSVGDSEYQTTVMSPGGINTVNHTQQYDITLLTHPMQSVTYVPSCSPPPMEVNGQEQRKIETPKGKITLLTSTIKPDAPTKVVTPAQLKGIKNLGLLDVTGQKYPYKDPSGLTPVLNFIHQKDPQAPKQMISTSNLGLYGLLVNDLSQAIALDGKVLTANVRDSDHEIVGLYLTRNCYRVPTNYKPK